MRIGIVGAGRVGIGIGGALSAAGHDVVYAGREPGRTIEAPAGSGAMVTTTSIRDAAQSTDALVVTIPGAGVPDLFTEHAGAFDGRLVLDATNHRGQGGSFHQVPAILAAVPGVRLYRAFCTLGYEHFADPRRTGAVADLHFCGADGADRTTVESLVASLGLRPVWVGGLDQADAVDGATKLWFALAARPDVGRDVTFHTLGLDRTDATA